MTKTDQLTASRTILDAFRYLVQAIHVSSKSVEAKLGISGAQLFVLQKIFDTQICSINELAEKTLTHQSSVSVVVDRLLEKALIHRAPDHADRRRVQVAITDKGRRLLKRAPLTPQERLARAVIAMSDSRRQQLAATLTDILVSADVLVAKGKAKDRVPSANLFFEQKRANEGKK